MTKIVELRTLAHARAGDKGNRSNVSVFAYDPKDFGLLEAQVTESRLKLHFGHLLRGSIQRFMLPKLYGINLVIDDALGGGVNESLNLDSHGKSWSFLVYLYQSILMLTPIANPIILADKLRIYVE